MKNGAEKDNDFYRASKVDAVVIGLVLSLSILSIFWIAKNHRQHSSQPRVARIYQENNLLEEADLAKDNTLAILNGRMHIEIKGGKLRVLDSDCPQHICVNLGWIQYSGQTIACVPNQVLVEIKSRGSQALDAVVY